MDLVIMAAGLGQRYGKGIKQLEGVGPNNELIIDYSIFDAINTEFDRVIFIIRKDIESDFKKIIGDRISKKVKVDYVFQETSDIPLEYQGIFKNRSKPWGTGQAILACKNLITGPFVVINADDYYGQKAFKKTYEFLNNPKNKNNACMVGFLLKNTLSQNGGVTRGICKVKDRKLLDIVETKNIEYFEGLAVANNSKVLSLDSVCSMNMWGFYPNIFDILEREFNTFLEKLSVFDLTQEFLLPTIVGNLLKQKEISVDVLCTDDKWFGVTYKEDKDFVVKNIQHLVDEKIYPQHL